MHILSIYSSYFPIRGGIQTVIKNISEYLVKKNHTVSVICFSMSGQSSQDVINGVHVYRINDPYESKLLGYSVKFNDFCRKNIHLLNEADVIHIHGYASLFSWQAIRSLTKMGFSGKIVFNPHYEGIGFSPLARQLHKIYKLFGGSSFTLPRKIICVSEYERKNVIRNFKIDGDKIRVIANGITYPVGNSPAIKTIDPRKIHLLYIGRVIHKKGIHYVLEALEILKKDKDCQYIFNIVGDGPYRDHLEGMVKDLKLQNIHFLGRVSESDLQNILYESDIFFLLSESEAYGLVVAEALANNVFAVISNTTALTEFCSEPGCFCVDYPPDKHKLAQIVKDLVKDGGYIGPFDAKKIRHWDISASEYEVEYLKLSNR
jgi:glycogen synthase